MQWGSNRGKKTDKLAGEPIWVNFSPFKSTQEPNQRNLGA